jgi:hypothetical protein
MRRFRSPHRRADHVDDAPCGAYGTRWRHRPCEGCTGQRTRQSRSVGVRTGSPRAEHEHDGGDEDEGNVPEQVERHYGAGVGPVRLALLQMLRSGLPHQQRRLPHRPAPTLPQQPRRASERRPPQRAAVKPIAAAEERRRVHERIAAGSRGVRCRHREKPSGIAGRGERVFCNHLPCGSVGELERD